MVLDLNDIIGVLTLLVTCIPGAWFLIRFKRHRERDITNTRRSFCDIVRDSVFFMPFSRVVTNWYNFSVPVTLGEC